MSTKPATRNTASRKTVIKKPTTAPGTLNRRDSAPKVPHPHSASSSGAHPTNRLKLKIANLFKKSICGDIFGSSMSGGNSMLGMMYQSRTKTKGLFDHSDMDRLNEDDVDEDELDGSQKLDVGDSSGSDDDSINALNPRQQLARTINNWSEHAANDNHIMREGGVHALIALAAFDDPGIKKCVATA